MIEVEHEPVDGCLDRLSVERCCICRKPTRYWFTPKDVACCPDCACQAEPDDIPDKDTWFRRERIANGRLR